MMESVYTMPQLKERWKEYKEAVWYRYMRDGKTYASRTLPDSTTEAAHKVEMVKARDVMSFPKYLETVSG